MPFRIRDLMVSVVPNEKLRLAELTIHVQDGPDCGATGCGTTDTPDCGATGCGTTNTPDCGATGCGTTDHAGACVASIDERTIFTVDPGELTKLQANLRVLQEAVLLRQHEIAVHGASQLTGIGVQELPANGPELASLETRLQEALAEVQARRARQ